MYFIPLNIERDHSKIIEGLFDFNTSSFEEKALSVFRLQASLNPVYREYLRLLKIDPESIWRLCDIPFLPISFFKTHAIATGNFEPEAVFESSGTTGSATSRHQVKDLSLYRRSYEAGFEQFYGQPQDWCIIALLPSYLERRHSSLVVMADALIRESGHPKSGFYLYEHDRLHQVLQELEAAGQRTLLLGVTFALLDFAEAFPMQLKHTIVMETGGMKGRREEWTRDEVHSFLQARWGIEQVHSEYGMTELLSQAYSAGGGRFLPARTLRVLIRAEDDPFAVADSQAEPVRGILNLVDLANIWSCSFIATDDAGTLYPDGSFEVRGRVDNSDIRGCSLMVV